MFWWFAISFIVRISVGRESTDFGNGRAVDVLTTVSRTERPDHPSVVTRCGRRNRNRGITHRYYKWLLWPVRSPTSPRSVYAYCISPRWNYVITYTTVKPYALRGNRHDLVAHFSGPGRFALSPIECHFGKNVQVPPSKKKKTNRPPTYVIVLSFEFAARFQTKNIIIINHRKSINITDFHP